MKIKYTVYTLDRSNSDVCGNELKDLIVEKIIWNYREADEVFIEGGNVLDEGDDICIKDDASGDVLFVGKVFEKKHEHNVYFYHCYGFEQLLVSKDVLMDYDNENPVNILVDLFSYAKDEDGDSYFYVDTADSSTYDGTITVKGIHKAWMVIVDILDALGWMLKIEHGLSESCGSKYCVKVLFGDVDNSNVVKKVCGVSSYYYKKYGSVSDSNCNLSNWNCVLLDKRNDVGNVINKYYYSTKPSMSKTIEKFDSSNWDNPSSGEYILNLSHKVSVVKSISYVDSNNNTGEIPDSQYTVSTDGYKITINTNIDNISSISVLYVYNVVYWSTAKNNDSILKYGERSKKVLVNWTNNIDVAKEYIEGVLSYTAFPSIKGKVSFKGLGNNVGDVSFDSGDLLYLYHDIENNPYVTYIVKVRLPDGMVQFETLDLKYRIWNVDVEKRLEKLENGLNDESRINSVSYSSSVGIKVGMSVKGMCLNGGVSNSNGYWYVGVKRLGLCKYGTNYDLYNDIYNESGASNSIGVLHFGCGVSDLCYNNVSVLGYVNPDSDGNYELTMPYNGLFVDNSSGNYDVYTVGMNMNVFNSGNTMGDTKVLFYFNVAKGDTVLQYYELEYQSSYDSNGNKVLNVSVLRGSDENNLSNDGNYTIPMGAIYNIIIYIDSSSKNLNIKIYNSDNSYTYTDSNTDYSLEEGYALTLTLTTKLEREDDNSNVIIVFPFLFSYKGVFGVNPNGSSFVFGSGTGSCDGDMDNQLFITIDSSLNSNICRVVEVL